MLSQKGNKTIFVSSNLAFTVQVRKQPTTFPSLSEGKYILQKKIIAPSDSSSDKDIQVHPSKKGYFSFLFHSFSNLAATKEATKVGRQS